MNEHTPEAIRINKYLSQAGYGSRRKVEDLVRQRRVQVDGETIEDLSTRVTPDHVVKVDGTTVHPARKTAVFALNKPVRVLVSEYDPEGRPLAINLVRHLYSGRLFSVGRLDFLSSGLLLFTNDGDLAQALMRPTTALEREYVVETSDPITDETLETITRGITIEGVRYRIARYQRHAARRVSLVLEEGKNREIRRVFAHYRLRVRRIYRNRYGPITLGKLPEGEARPLTANEIQRLQAATSGSGAKRKPSRSRGAKGERPW
ncbi:MAG TPA: pseudouridine synthase [Alkalispirochaeta sp.]|nr:pseudouridine synthase [Alkalispirochaeta sp.]